MKTMTNQRVRHVPVVDDDGLLVSIVSIGDVVKRHIESLDTERQALQDYINS
jgi:CBS-domain-containing membrane protein